MDVEARVPLEEGRDLPAAMDGAPVPEQNHGPPQVPE